MRHGGYGPMEPCREVKQTGMGSINVELVSVATPPS